MQYVWATGTQSMPLHEPKKMFLTPTPNPNKIKPTTTIHTPSPKIPSQIGAAPNKTVPGYPKIRLANNPKIAIN